MVSSLHPEFRCTARIGLVNRLRRRPVRVPTSVRSLTLRRDFAISFPFPRKSSTMQLHINILRPVSLALLVAVCFLSSAGCGGGEHVVSVSGTVTHNGQPVSGLVVSFVPEAVTETGVSSGETDESGKYSLKVAKTGSSGAVVGKHKVWVSLPRERPPADKEDKPAKPKTKATTERADFSRRFSRNTVVWRNPR